MNNLAITLWQMDERIPVLQLMLAAANGRARVLGPEHPYALSSRRAAEQMQAALGQQGGTG